jgi:wyosine [tRNA(Phe)-imidazoG37] synthetase (radical SAM superfamily)
LHSGLGWLIGQVKKLSELPVAVITNGSLLYLPEVRQALARADVVMPSLDAGTAELYRQINRSHPEVTFERLVNGLAAFRQTYGNRLWVEVMLMQGLNDSEVALQAVAAILQRIKPDQVHINQPTRPPAETWVRPADQEGLTRAMSILGATARVVHPAQGSFDLGGGESVVEAIMGIITRHPMRQEELSRVLTEWDSEQVDQVLTDLQASGQAQRVERYGSWFWCARPGRYPNEAASLASAQGKPRGHKQRPYDDRKSELSA